MIPPFDPNDILIQISMITLPFYSYPFPVEQVVEKPPLPPEFDVTTFGEDSSSSSDMDDPEAVVPVKVPVVEVACLEVEMPPEAEVACLEVEMPSVEVSHPEPSP